MNIVCVSNRREALPSNLKKCFVLVNARRMTDEYRLRSYEPALCGPPRPAECPRSLPFAQPGLRAVRIFLLSRSGPHPGVIEKNQNPSRRRVRGDPNPTIRSVRLRLVTSQGSPYPSLPRVGLRRILLNFCAHFWGQPAPASNTIRATA